MPKIISFTVLFTALFFAGPLGAQQKLNVYQTEYLTSKINLSLNKLFAALQEERYLDTAYGLGTVKSKEQVTAEEFALRMNQNPWKILTAESKLTKLDIKTFTYALIEYDMTFARKLNKGEKVTIKILLQTFYEKQKDGEEWRFDLFEIMTLPLKI